MGRPLKRRGFLIVLCLLLTVLLLVLGLGFMGKRSAQYRRTGQAELAARAKAMAEAGLEDALLKLDRDLEFPPMSSDQEAFSYSEQTLDDDGERIGGYTVTFEGLHHGAPYYVLVLTCSGEIGADPAKPEARRTLRAEIDMSPPERVDFDGDGTLKQPNPFFRKVRNFNDLGAF